MSASPATAKALLAASGLVLVAGAALAVAKPGDLGDDDDADGTAADVTTTTTTVLGGPSDTSVTIPGDPGASTTAVPGASTTAVPGASTTAVPGASTTAPGSGIGSDGASVADDGTAATGMESMLVPALALVSAGAVARAASRRSRA